MRFDQPVGTQADRDSPLAWSGGWFDATGFATYYTATGAPAFHPGSDLNLGNYGDVLAPVCAPADGVVVFAGLGAGWQRRMVCISHGAGIWTRCAHLDNLAVIKGQVVKRGERIGYIGDYGSDGAPNDHLDYSVSRKDLGLYPTDWPGMNLARLKIDYIDPREWTNAHRIDDKPQEPEMSKMKVIPSEGLRVRTTPDSSSTGNVLGKLPGDSVVEVNDVEGGWAEMDVTFTGASAGGVTLAASALKLFGYSSAQYLQAVTDPPPTPPPTANKLHAKYLLGVHTLNFTHNAFEAFALGCRAATIMDDGLGAYQLAQQYPDSIVMVRRYIANNRPPPNEMVNLLSPGNLPNLYYTFACEGTGDANDLRGQFDWERQCSEEVWRRAPLAKVCLMTAAHGNPDITSADVCRSIRETYAPWLNSHVGRAFLDTHAYTFGKRFADDPPNDASIVDPQWFETRNQMLQTSWGGKNGIADCGLSDAVGHVSTETGVEAGASQELGQGGGFSYARYTDAQFERWCAWWVNAQRESKAGYKAATIFQASERTDWAGYGIRNRYAVLSKLWQNDVPVLRSFELMRGQAYDPPPGPGYKPPFKEMF